MEEKNTCYDFGKKKKTPEEIEVQIKPVIGRCPLKMPFRNF